MVDISLIVLSKTDDETIYNMTKTCFDSFIKSAQKVNKTFEIVLVESNKETSFFKDYKNIKIITPSESFNFHKYLNVGLKNTSAETYVLSNNDVVFDEYWLEELFKVSDCHKEIMSFSPYDINSNKLNKDIILNNDFVCGYEIQKHITGWCIVLKQDVIKKIKALDERFLFYYADFDYALTLIKYNFKHALITKSKVFHLESMSSKTKKVKPFVLPKRTPKYVINQNWTWVLGNEKMIEGLIVFHDKWGSRRLIKLKQLIAERLANLGLGYFNKYIV